VKDIEKNRKNNTRIFFERTNEVRRSFKSRNTIIRMEDGILLTENDKIAKAFKTIFQTLLNQPRRDVESEECDTIEQIIERTPNKKVKTGLDMLKNRKASGADYRVPECLNNGGEQLIKQLHKLINKIWDQEKISTAWSTSVLCPMFKKGDTMNCTNIIIEESPYSIPRTKYYRMFYSID
jgi:hypothetical protein